MMRFCRETLLTVQLMFVFLDSSEAFFCNQGDSIIPTNNINNRHSSLVQQNNQYPTICPLPSSQKLTTTSRSSSSRISHTILRVANSPTKLSDPTSSEDDDNDGKGAIATSNATVAAITKSAFATVANGSVSRFRKLKDIMWVRDSVEDVTAAKFACSVESEAQLEGNTKRKRAVDYEKLLSQLNRRIGDMLCTPFVEINGGGQPTIDKDNGMGRYAYTEEERAALLKNILKTRENLMEIMKSHNLDVDGNDEEGSNGFAIKIPEIPEISIPKEEGEASTTSAGPKLYVRDDGTVEWEGALQDRAALRKFGGAVWARINGQTPADVDDDDDDDDDIDDNKMAKHSNNEALAHQQENKEVTVKIEETPEITKARKELKKLQDDLKALEKSHTALLNSGIQAGQAVANVKLASLDPKLRSEIRQSADDLEELNQKVSYQTLVYELERIYAYLATDLGNPANKGYVPLQDRLNVAEYGLLEGQVENCSRDLNTKGVIDADILAVIRDQMIDFKRRLGIDYYVTGFTYDREAILTWLNDLLQQAKSGLMFYVKGCELFWNDILFCSALIARAAQGYTLKPREVRTIRRTFKDIITFIPVVIILIIPLSPVGHVLVFGAIQRFFPDFFPSCFTEQRQNLLQLYETTEYSEFTIKESFDQQFARFREAVFFSIASTARNAFNNIANPKDNE